MDNFNLIIIRSWLPSETLADAAEMHCIFISSSILNVSQGKLKYLIAKLLKYPILQNN